MRATNVFLARDAYGWFTGPRLDLSLDSRYFVLEDFCSAMPPRYEEVDEGGLHAGWSLDEPRRHHGRRSLRQICAPCARWPLEYAADLGETLIA